MTKKFIVEIEDGADTRWLYEENLLKELDFAASGAAATCSVGTIPRVTVREETAVEKNLMFIGKMTVALEEIKHFKERYPDFFRAENERGR